MMVTQAEIDKNNAKIDAWQVEYDQAVIDAKKMAKELAEDFYVDDFIWRALSEKFGGIVEIRYTLLDIAKEARQAFDDS